MTFFWTTCAVASLYEPNRMTPQRPTATIRVAWRPLAPHRSAARHVNLCRRTPIRSLLIAARSWSANGHAGELRPGSFPCVAAPLPWALSSSFIPQALHASEESTGVCRKHGLVTARVRLQAIDAASRSWPDFELPAVMTIPGVGHLAWAGLHGRRLRSRRFRRSRNLCAYLVWCRARLSILRGRRHRQLLKMRRPANATLLYEAANVMLSTLQRTAEDCR